MTIHASGDAELTKRIVSELRAGKVWGLNADSSYALCADAFSAVGVKRIRDLKGRADLITPILIGRQANIEGIAAYPTNELRAMVEAFWPGPLTVVVHPTPSLAWSATPDAISIRMPMCESTREIAFELGPMVAVGAARGQHRAPTTAIQASEIWGSDVDDWLDAGMADPNQVSTIVDFRSATPNIVRLGALSAQQLREVVPGTTMISY